MCLLNEPSTAPHGSTRKRNDLYDRLYTSIRAIDPDHIIQVEAWGWPEMGITAANEYGLENVMFHFHACRMDPKQRIDHVVQSD